jgi:2-dehydro-3-deoxyphosphooctonate aldolase (KDO 8-P synthase)
LIGLGLLHVGSGLKLFDGRRVDANIETHYVIGKAIGAGGMGVVYEAHDKRLKRMVAIKMLRDEFQLDAAVKEAFVQEARTVAELHHPSIVDIHSVEQSEPVAAVADVLQIPAFLCRQTDLIAAGASACAKHSRALNVKKGQFLAPWDAKNIVEKVRSVSPNLPLAITERGTSFGYNSLIVDMTSFQTISRFGVPVIYDATHSIQTPGGGPGGKSTGGRREALEVLARGAMAAGASGVFFECHPEPEKAKSDGPNALPLKHAGEFVRQCLEFHLLAQKTPKLLPEARA